MAKSKKKRLPALTVEAFMGAYTALPEGGTIEDLAKVLERPVGSVRQRMHAVRKLFEAKGRKLKPLARVKSSRAPVVDDALIKKYNSVLDAIEPADKE
jgi:hypothetical protein